MARRKKQFHEEHAAAGHERWLVSYADMITLLFCLFLILYAMSKVNEQKFNVLSKSLSEAIDKTEPKPTQEVDDEAMSSASLVPLSVPPDAVPTESPQDGIDAAEEEAMRKLAESLRRVAVQHGWRKQLLVHRDEQGLVVTLVCDGVMFDTGEADVRAGAIPIILAVGQSIRPFPNLVRVEGHTDNVPLQGGPYKTNWGLSTMRATSVAEVMIKQAGLDPKRMSVLGYGETRPRVPNTTELFRQQNRRVEIMVLKRDAKDDAGGAR